MGFRFVKAAMEEAGLVVREDAIGNMFGRWYTVTLAPGYLEGS